MAWIGWLLVKNGVNVIFDATANKRAYRERARELIGPGRFAEIYVRCPLEVCMARDVKGIYKMALKGEATTVPGLQVPYEEPSEPAVVVDTSEMGPEECVNKILKFVLSHFYGRERTSSTTKRKKSVILDGGKGGSTSRLQKP